MGYCILCAIRFGLETKELAELLGGKMGRNSLTLKKLLGEIFPRSPQSKVASLRPRIYYVAAIAREPYSRNQYPETLI
jgi:hypothetical protein